MRLFVGVFEMPTICPMVLILSIFSKRQLITKLAVGVRRHFVPTTNCPTGFFWATNCPRWQNVPLSPHATNCPSDKMSHFLPGDKMSHWWSYWKTMVSLAFFGRQIVPRWQNVPLSPRWQNVPTYALMHMKVMESCWDILSPVKVKKATFGNFLWCYANSHDDAHWREALAFTYYLKFD